MKTKYKYTGQKNNKCPVCGSKENVGPPVIYLQGNQKLHQHRWCVACFNLAQRMVGRASSVDLIENYLLPFFQTHTDTLMREKATGKKVTGFQLLTIPNQGLTLVLELV